MARLKWDQVGERYYETGTKQGVLYLKTEAGYGAGIAWNGLTGFSESPDGADTTDLYADDIKYLSIRAKENFKGTITAYTYPEEFEQCDGSASPIKGMKIGQQVRKPFGFVYRTAIGNDVDYDDHGYKIHIVYGATASPSSKDFKTINDSPEAIEFSWEIDTVPVEVGKIGDVTYKPTATIELDSTRLSEEKMTAIEDILYGTDGTESYTAFSGSAFETGTTYYERSGNTGSYVYTPTTDTSKETGKTYYTKSVNGGNAARLPLPAEIYAKLAE